MVTLPVPVGGLVVTSDSPAAPITDGPMKKAYDAAVADYTLEQLETIRDYWRRGVEVGEAQLARLRGETGSKVA